MFGIGPGEMIVLLVVLLIAVGPKSMPAFMKAVGRGLREFRRATDDLRQQVGLDDLMRDDEWRDPLGLNKPARPRSSPARDGTLTPADHQREYPPEGVDVRHAREETRRRAGADGGPLTPDDGAGEAGTGGAASGGEPQ
jgi:TatA/E family protein of Tat protein translocase